jgi:hypothetical protein
VLSRESLIGAQLVSIRCGFLSWGYYRHTFF